MARKDEDSFWFKFYPDKYLGGTAGFTLEMHGAYMLMLFHQWSNGPFLEEEAVSIVGGVWAKIKRKFVLTETGYANIKMVEESNHKQSISKIRRAAALTRYKCTANALQMQNKCTANGMQTDSSSSSSSFDTFWAAYPKKQGKGAAIKAWGKIRKPAETLALIMAALEWQRTSDQWRKDGGQYIPMPSTYINGQRWLDERVAAPRPKTGFACNDGYIGAGQPLLDLLDPTPEPEDDNDGQ